LRTAPAGRRTWRILGAAVSGAVIGFLSGALDGMGEDYRLSCHTTDAHATQDLGKNTR